MNKMNEIKAKQLNMPTGTASAILRKNIMFHLLKRLGENFCFQCKKEIETVDELSIEHKIPWLHSENPTELFFSIDNIAFSHLKCNIMAGRNKQGVKHPSQESYKRGCRCQECTEIQRVRIKNYRAGGR